MPPDASLAPFYDRDGRITRLPRKRRGQLLLYSWLAEQFDSGTRYRESEVNELLDRLHTFGDASGLRRALCDWGYLGRERDGSAYWLITTSPPEVD